MDIKTAHFKLGSGQIVQLEGIYKCHKNTQKELTCSTLFSDFLEVGEVGEVGGEGIVNVVS